MLLSVGELWSQSTDHLSLNATSTLMFFWMKFLLIASIWSLFLFLFPSLSFCPTTYNVTNNRLWNYALLVNTGLMPIHGCFFAWGFWHMDIGGIILRGYGLLQNPSWRRLKHRKSKSLPCKHATIAWRKLHLGALHFWGGRNPPLAPFGAFQLHFSQFRTQRWPFSPW